jgi:transposase-like protein
MAKRPPYDAATKEHAIKLAAQVGKAEAARRTGISAGTIGAWCSRAGVATGCTELMRAATEARTATHEARRAALAEQMLLIAEKAAELELAKMVDAPLFQVVGSRTRAIHDHQLLAGAATSRTEVVGREVATTVLDELKARRAQVA